MGKPIQIFEHGVLRVGTGGFKGGHFDQLVLYNERNGNRFFSVGHQRIHFHQFVGVIQVGRVTIEVLPKADKGPESEGSREKWHGVLVDMLHRCGLIRLETPTAAHLSRRRASLFDLYLDSFLQETSALVDQGLARKYRRVQSNLPVFKGRLLVGPHLRHNLVHRERVYCEHTRYDRDNVFNRVLKRALAVVQATAPSADLASRAGQLRDAFGGVTDIQPTRQTFRRVRYDRSTERYRRAMTLAELIVLNYSPDVRGGRNDVLAILFDMNDLFERYVFCELKRAERAVDGAGLRVRPQRSQLFWRADGMRKTIRPDIVAELGVPGERDRLILDTKWKLPKDGKPADSDLKQMYAYNLEFGAKQSFLVYPRTGPEHDVVGLFGQGGQPSAPTGHGCGLWFVDLFDGDNKLDSEFGAGLAERVVAVGAGYGSVTPSQPDRADGDTPAHHRNVERAT